MCIRAIRDIDPRCQAVLMTGFATVDTAVEAIKLGAMDYLSKPLDFARLEQLLTSRPRGPRAASQPAVASRATSPAGSSSAA